MPQKIYKLCLIRGYKEAWYHLSEAEKQSLWDRVMKNLERLGVKSGPSYSCRWSNDQYSSWFTMEYPSVEAAIADTAVAEAADLWRYLISETIMGIEEVAQAAPP
jgi:hypothetical protein